MNTSRLTSKFTTAILAASFLMVSALSGQAATYRWTGGGSDDFWSTVGNWEVNSGSWVPAATAPGAGDVAILGNATATDEAQEVILNNNVAILRLEMEATGNRDYVISSSPNDAYTLSLTAAIWVSAFDQAAGATCDLTLRVKMDFSAASSTYARLYSTAHARVIAERKITTSGAKNAETLYLYGKAINPGAPGPGGILELRVPISPFRLTMNFGAVLLLNYEGEDPVVTSNISLNSYSSIWVQRSASIAGGLWFSTLPTVYVRAYQAGDSNIVLNVTDFQRGGNYDIGPSLPESSATFTLTIQNMNGPSTSGTHAPDMNLASNTVLVLGRDQTLPTSMQVLPRIYGAGAVMKSKIAPSYLATSTIGMTNTYTGGTFVNDGTLKLIDGYVPVTVGSTTTNYFFGQIGPGLLSLGTNGIFDLNGIDQTVSTLQGGGKVLLGGATLSLTNGVAPGTNGVGTLTIAETGELTIVGGTSRFDFTSNTAVFDRVVLTEAAQLTLAGALVVTAPSDFSEYGSGRYTLFDLNGGVLVGAFSTIIPPDGMAAEIDDSSGDVVLVLRMSGTIIVVR